MNKFRKACRLCIKPVFGIILLILLVLLLAPNRTISGPSEEDLVELDMVALRGVVCILEHRGATPSQFEHIAEAFTDERTDFVSNKRDWKAVSATRLLSPYGNTFEYIPTTRAWILLERAHHIDWLPILAIAPCIAVGLVAWEALRVCYEFLQKRITQKGQRP